MPDIQYVTPDEAKKYQLGSILNGGGSWPNNKKTVAKTICDGGLILVFDNNHTQLTATITAIGADKASAKRRWASACSNNGGSAINHGNKTGVANSLSRHAHQ